MMRFEKFKRVVGLLMCIFMMGTLLQVKEASASTCYNHDDKKVVYDPGLNNIVSSFYGE